MARSRKSKAAPFNVAEIADKARNHPYVYALLHDHKLQKDVRTALASGQRVYARLSNGNVAPRPLLEDKRLHSELGRALGAARDVTITITNTKRKRRRRLRVGRVLIIGTIGVGVAVATSEKLRSKALDMLFGAEEEFQYTPPPNSSTAESTTAVGAA
jgi:hypothetical protein